LRPPVNETVTGFFSPSLAMFKSERSKKANADGGRKLSGKDGGDQFLPLPQSPI